MVGDPGVEVEDGFVEGEGKVWDEGKVRNVGPSGRDWVEGCAELSCTQFGLL